MKRRLLLFLICLLFGTFITTYVTATTLQITDGQLMGALGVTVDGQLYDVEFIDDSALSIWGSTDYDFTFKTAWQSGLASAALLEQVFIDSELYNFDTDPNLTAGIGPMSSQGSANVLTPYLFEETGYPQMVRANWASNHYIEVDDASSYNGQSYSIYMDSAGYEVFVYAKWSEASAVPEPNTLMLFGVGCLGLAGFSRRRKE